MLLLLKILQRRIGEGEGPVPSQSTVAADPRRGNEDSRLDERGGMHILLCEILNLTLQK